MNTDSGEYHVLTNAVRNVVDVDGMTCEIGIREGGSSYLIMQALKETGQNKIHVGIDPFGNIDYLEWETRIVKLDYSNKMKQKMLMNIYKYCNDADQEFLFFPLEDTEFFKRYADGIPIYNNNKYIINKYALVFFDGPHATGPVKEEFDFFESRMAKGGYVVFDDLHQYPHMEVLDPYIISKGFEMMEKGRYKISYRKI